MSPLLGLNMNWIYTPLRYFVPTQVTLYLKVMTTKDAIFGDGDLI